MSKIEVKNVQERVAEKLEVYPSLRDNDARLVANIWLEDAKAHDPNLDVNRAKYFLRLVAEGVLTNTESIRRSRQILQQKNPALRGELYYQRKNHSFKIKAEVLEVKDSIHNQRTIDYGSKSK